MVFWYLLVSEIVLSASNLIVLEEDNALVSRIAVRE